MWLSVLQKSSYYTDYEYRFRLGYNFHPDSHEIEIVVIHLLDPSIN